MRFRAWASVFFAALLVGILLMEAPSVRGVSSTLVISEFRTRGPNGGSDEFVELFNLSPNAVNIGGWKIRGSNAAGTVSTRATIPAGTMLSSGCHYLFTNSSTSGGPYSGSVPGDQTYATGITDDGGVALTLPDDSIVDQAGMSAGSAFREGTPLAPLTTNVNRGYERKPGGASGSTQDTDNNAADFQLISPSLPQNLASPCIVLDFLSGTGAATPSEVEPGGLVLLTVNVTPASSFPGPSTNIMVTANLTSIGGAALQMFFDDGTNGDAVAGDNKFTFRATVDPGTTLGAKTLPATVQDAQGRSANTAINLTVTLPTPIVISEFRTRGPSGGNDEFIELFNRTILPVDVSGWLIRGSNASGTVGNRATIPSGKTILPGCFYLLTNSASGGYSGAVAGDQTYSTGVTDDGGIGLTRPDSVIVDQVGMSTGSAFKEGTVLAPLTTNVNRSYERKPGGVAGNGTDTNNNSADFQLITPSLPQNSMSPCIPISAITPPFGIGAADPDTLEAGEMTLLTVAVTNGMNPTSTGLAVQADLSPVGGSAAQAFFDDASNGDVTAGDRTFSFEFTLANSTAPGEYTIPVSVSDAQSRMSNTSIHLTVVAVRAIHDIQGTGNTSPFVNMLVRTRGIVTAVSGNGFFIQTPESDVDADPTTSEGIFVFTGSAPSAAATVGNFVSVTGFVREFRPASDPPSPTLTEIGGSPDVLVLAVAQPVPAPFMLTAANTDPLGPIDQLERFEGMRVHVSSLTVVSPTDGFVDENDALGSSNGVFYGVITGVARPFREQGVDALDAAAEMLALTIPRFDTNPERIRVASTVLGGTQLNLTAGALVTDLTGPLDFFARTYTILPEPTSPPGVSGIGAAVPVPVAGINEFTVGAFNLERFFDTTNDPGIGEPVLTAAAFERRLKKASMAIRNVMRAPDILGVEEVENLSTLQALANRINDDAVAAGQPNPLYTAHLFEGNDVGGIDVGLLVKAGRVNVMDVFQVGKDELVTNPDGSTALLNDRPSLVLRAEIHPELGLATPVTVIVNHLRSLSGINDPADGERVRNKRRAQAESLANYVQSRQAADPAERIILVGDFNAFQFNDGYVDVMGIIRGSPAPAAETVLPGTDLVNPDLIDLVDLADAAQRYSFLFDGNAQVLDHILITQNLQSSFSRFHYARNDADFPESFRSDDTRPERISDHDMPVAYFFLPPVPVAIDIKPGTFPNTINLGSNGVVPVAIISTPTFDAGQVDPLSVTLAGAGAKLKGNGTPQASLEDVNGDGLRDLVIHVTTSTLQLSSTDTVAVLEGMTFNGRRIRGTDTVRIVP